MVRYSCFVPGCPSHQHNCPDSVSFHGCTTIKSVREAWMRILNCRLGKMICSRHFNPQCFRLVTTYRGTQKFLKTGSLPNKWNPVYFPNETTNKHQVISTKARGRRRYDECEILSHQRKKKKKTSKRPSKGYCIVGQGGKLTYASSAEFAEYYTENTYIESDTISYVSSAEQDDCNENIYVDSDTITHVPSAEFEQEVYTDNSGVKVQESKIRWTVPEEQVCPWMAADFPETSECIAVGAEEEVIESSKSNYVMVKVEKNKDKYNKEFGAIEMDQVISIKKEVFDNDFNEFYVVNNNRSQNKRGMEKPKNSGYTDRNPQAPTSGDHSYYAYYLDHM